jgi:NAD(P)-dependent dehydrogenase (short-subunit alcohol dehydrogenase family)
MTTEIPDKSGMQTAIVTGGNGGLGYHCARTIAAASPQWHVIIASRDRAKSLEAARAIAAESGNPNVMTVDLDLGSPSSARKFVAKFADRHGPPLKAIVCNAGVQFIKGLTYSSDGYETTFAVNHLGHFLLVNLLLGHLEAPARIAVVSSGTHNPASSPACPSPCIPTQTRLQNRRLKTIQVPPAVARTPLRSYATSCLPTNFRDGSRPPDATRLPSMHSTRVSCRELDWRGITPGSRDSPGISCFPYFGFSPE